MQHFIWVFTVCKSTRVGVSHIQRVDSFCIKYRMLKSDDPDQTAHSGAV